MSEEDLGPGSHPYEGLMFVAALLPLLAFVLMLGVAFGRAAAKLFM